MTPDKAKLLSEEELERYLENEYEHWKKETIFLSVGVTNNIHFKNICDVGLLAIPFIYKKLEEEPSHLVHAYDVILPDLMKVDGYVGVGDYINMWQVVIKIILDNIKENNESLENLENLDLSKYLKT